VNLQQAQQHDAQDRLAFSSLLVETGTPEAGFTPRRYLARVLAAGTDPSRGSLFVFELLNGGLLLTVEMGSTDHDAVTVRSRQVVEFKSLQEFRKYSGIPGSLVREALAKLKQLRA
jgi:hypothetical protein